ncbi:MAG TPA: biopolymer transporter ExbD [Candidatus Latescibacteria bacterium]|jgi:biopolymer transport protein ExbD|nr:biopolymer transporter ExbD [Candidatus Latescibacterota bacterium]
MPRHRQRHTGPIGEEFEPDLTPLVDCVFLLLVFFMVTTVFLHTKGLDVDMPSQSEAMEEQKKDINVLLSPEGKIQIKGLDVEPEQLRERLQESMEEANNKNIIINADGECAQRYVVFVVDEARAVGVEGIAFAREEEP